MGTLLNRSGFNKRSGIPIHEVVYTLSLWLWLKKESIGMFARDSLQGMGKDVLYDTLNPLKLKSVNMNGPSSYSITLFVGMMNSETLV